MSLAKDAPRLCRRLPIHRLAPISVCIVQEPVMTITPLSPSVDTRVLASPVSGPVAGSPSTSRVDQALDTIRDRLDEGFFNDVSQGDLRDINATLSGLTAEERNAVVSELSDDELNKWTDELDNSG